MSPGGIWKAVESCTDMGGSCFALFLGSQRSWKRPSLNPDAAAKFQEGCSLHGFDPAHILPHGSYLMNCGSPKEGQSHTGMDVSCRNSSFSALVTHPCLAFVSSSLTSSSGLYHSDVFEKSQALLVDELRRCSLLGLNLYNFHPGSSLGSITTEQCVDKIAGAINHAHQQTPAVVTGTGGGRSNKKTLDHSVELQT